jgi:CheY-like chemotaxis protein
MRKLNLPYTVASNGLEALESYSTNSGEFCCVLMGKSTHSFVGLQSNLVCSDISMPVMDGLESTRRIREHEQTRQLAPATIIALTGLASASARQEAFASGKKGNQQ